MRYFKTLLLFVAFVVASVSSLHAQAIDSAFGYFPMQVGNRWVYDSESDMRQSDSIPSGTLEITADTIMPNGYRYWKFVGPFVPIGNGLIFSLSYMRVDSVTGELKAYDTAAQQDYDYKLSWGGGPGYATVGPVFGTLVPVRYYMEAHSIVVYDRIYAYGIGPIYWEEEYHSSMPNHVDEWRLLYAKVNGVEFGRLTDVERDDPGLVFNVSHSEHGIPLFSFTLPTASRARITLVDVRGNEMHVLDEEYSAGKHRYHSPSLDLSSGSYVAVLRTDDGVVVERLMVAR